METLIKVFNSIFTEFTKIKTDKYYQSKEAHRLDKVTFPFLQHQLMWGYCKNFVANIFFSYVKRNILLAVFQYNLSRLIESWNDK